MLVDEGTLDLAILALALQVFTSPCMNWKTFGFLLGWAGISPLSEAR